ncbi:MAG: cytochrome c [Myxococcota bacterium]
MSLPRATLLLSLLLLGPALARAQSSDAAVPVAPAAPKDAPSDEPRRLVLMIQYIATDWPNAVVDGKVVNQVEYEEALQNAADGLERYRRLGKSKEQLPQLEKLKAAVEAKAPTTEIATLVRALVPALSEELGVQPFPPTTPDLKKGALVYQMACINCHGKTGDGDGPAGVALKPPPTAFADYQWSDQAAPFQLFNTVTLGIPDTGMGSFAQQLDENMRWSVAFYLLTLRRPPSPARADPRIGLRELSTLSNVQIVEKLMKDDATLTREKALEIADGARREMPKALSPDAAMDAMANAATRAAGMAKAGDKAGATDVVSSAYFDVVEPVEEKLRERHAAKVQTLESAITALRKAIMEGGDVDKAAQEVSARAQEIKQAWLQGAGPPPTAAKDAPPWGVIGAVVGIAVLALVGIFVLARKKSGTR